MSRVVIVRRVLELFNFTCAQYAKFVDINREDRISNDESSYAKRLFVSNRILWNENKESNETRIVDIVRIEGYACVILRACEPYSVKI